jgi:flagellar motor switch protein FliN/FliY
MSVVRMDEQLEKIPTQETDGAHPDNVGTTAEQAAERAMLEMETAQFQALTPGAQSGEKDKKMGLLLDLSLPVSIELGRTNLAIRDILDLQRGSIVEFEKLASEPVDIMINGKKMAEGEVVVIEKHFAIRITSLVDASERVKSLGK